MNPSRDRADEWESRLSFLVQDAARKRFELQKLRRILGYGDPIFLPPPAPLSQTRGEYVAMLQDAEENLDLADDIVSIVTETKFPSSLCQAVVEFEPRRSWRNFEKVKAAAPAILAAIGLRDIWEDWWEDFWLPESGFSAGEIRTSPSLIYELIDRGCRTDFLVRAILSRFFEEGMEFSDLFPHCDDEHRHVRKQLRGLVAGRIAHFYEEARRLDRRDRPDIRFQEDLLFGRLGQELMDSADPGTCVKLTAEITLLKTVEEPPPHCLADSFFRQQRERHFENLL